MCERKLRSSAVLNEDGSIHHYDVNYIHTCPICGSGPLPQPTSGAFTETMSKDLCRWVCQKCWPEFKRLGYA